MTTTVNTSQFNVSIWSQYFCIGLLHVGLRLCGYH